MEAVKAFNAELSSLYEVKPPISKAKMTALTRGAIKAIKFYKHVVQSVEKFILKCKPEYKVPGLYVIDSIVRQSRHQFGPEKDVFAPRFSKNLQQTFVNLFKCPPEDKSKIIRVLNLWQKNQVFSPEAVQPLFDLADPNNPIHQMFQQQQQSTPVQQTNGSQSQVMKGSPALQQRTPTKANQSTASEGPTPNLNLTEPVLQQLQQLQRLLTKSADVARPEQVHFDKKLLDFDYGEDEDEVHPSPRPPPSASLPADPVASLLTNPEVLRQLQTLQNTLAGAVNPPPPEMETDRMKKLHEMKLQEDEFDRHLAQTVPNLPFASECEFKVTQSSTMIGGLHFIPPQPDITQISQAFDMQHDNTLYSVQNNANDVEVITLDHDDSHSDDDRYGKRKKSRSRSRDRGREKDGRRRRSKSRSRSRNRRHRSKSKERKEKERKEKETERDKERKKRGLPAIKKDNLSVCSTTLWVGHLSKLVHQDDLSNTFGEFGDIVSIDLIVPRGCAFIVMHRRQDAARCLAKLKNHNLHGKAITLAWAPGKGVKGKDLKDYWEGDLGVSYIPWNKLRQDMDLEALEDGGMIDEDTMPDWMRKKMEESMKKRAPLEQPPFVMPVAEAPNHSTVDTSQPPPLPPANIMQPPMMPMVNPFQLNNRFLGMMPNLANLPLGVPPPNMAPPSMPPSMMGLGLSSPFQGPPSFMPSALPPPQQPDRKLNPPPTADMKLRNLSESLMNLAGQPLAMPPQALMSQPPPPLHTSMDDSMDVEMEDAGISLPPHTDLNKPPPSIPLSEQLQNSISGLPFNRDNRREDPRFSPGRRDSRDRVDNRDGRDIRKDDRGNDRSRRRSRSRDRDRDRNDRSGGRERDRRDRDRDGRDSRDFGRGGRDRDRDRRGGDRDRNNRWVPNDRRDDRRDGPYDRRGGPPDRRDGPPGRRDGGDKRDNSFDRRDGPGGRRDGPDKRDSDPRDKNDREKTLNDRLKEMAGIKLDEPGQDDRSGRFPGANEDAPSDGGFHFEPPPNVADDIALNLPPIGVRDDLRRSPREARNPSPPDFMTRPPPSMIPADESQAQGEELPNNPPMKEGPDITQPPPSQEVVTEMGDYQQFDTNVPPPFANNESFQPNNQGPFGFDEPRSFGNDGPGEFGPGPFGHDGPGPFGSDGPASGGHFGQDESGPGDRFGPDGPGPGSNFGLDGSGHGGHFGPDAPGPGGHYGSDGPGPGGHYGSDGPGPESHYGPDGPGPAGHFGLDGPGPGGHFGLDGPGGHFGPDGPGPGGRFGSDGLGPGSHFGPDGPGPGSNFGPDGPGLGSHFGPDGPGPGGHFGPDGPGRFRDQGPPFGNDGYGPPPDMMMDGPPGFGRPGFDGPPERFMRGGRRGRGRGRGRGGPDFFPRDKFGPPIRDEGFGPPIRDEGFGPPMRDNFGPPMRDDFGPPIRDDFGPPMRDDFGPPIRDDFGPPMTRGDDYGHRGPRMRGRAFFGRGGQRGRGGGPFRDGFKPEFDMGPPDYFRGGPRGRPFSEPFQRGTRGRGFRGGRGRPDFFDGPPGGHFEGGPFDGFPLGGAFEDGPPGGHFEDGSPGGHFEGSPPRGHFEGGSFEDGPPFDDAPPAEGPHDMDGRRGRDRKRNRLSRWGENVGQDEITGDDFASGQEDGGGTPLRDEINDCGGQNVDFAPPQEMDFAPPQEMDVAPPQEVNFEPPQEVDFAPSQDQEHPLVEHPQEADTAPAQEPDDGGQQETEAPSAE